VPDPPAGRGVKEIGRLATFEQRAQGFGIETVCVLGRGFAIRLVRNPSHSGVTSTEVNNER
jgi:hypothetical protein